jgi:hypothetical protein
MARMGTSALSANSRWSVKPAQKLVSTRVASSAAIAEGDAFGIGAPAGCDPRRSTALMRATSSRD